MLIFFNNSSLLKNIQELRLANRLFHLTNAFVYIVGELIQIVKSLNCEVLRRRLVVLNTFKVPNNVLSTFFLFINYVLKVVVLFVNLLKYFIFKSNLISNPLLHLSALGLMILAYLKNFLKLLYLLSGCHFKCLCLLTSTVLMVLQCTLETEDLFMVLAKYYIVVMLATRDAVGYTAFHFIIIKIFHELICH